MRKRSRVQARANLICAQFILGEFLFFYNFRVLLMSVFRGLFIDFKLRNYFLEK